MTSKSEVKVEYFFLSIDDALGFASVLIVWIGFVK